MEQLVKAVLELGDFSTEQISFFISKVKTRTLNKNAFLSKEGQVCQAIYFLNQGSLRQYCITHAGVENVLNLYVEKDWVMDYQSFTSQRTSGNNIQAFEDCEVFELSIWALHELFEHSSKYFLIGKLLQNISQPASMNGYFSSPEEKYREILFKKPQLLKKFPLNYLKHHIYPVCKVLNCMMYYLLKLLLPYAKGWLHLVKR